MATRRLLLGAALAAPVFTPALAQAPAWPRRAVRVVVAFAPGGPTDLLARQLTENLGEIWGQTVVVENRGGAGGNVGAQLVARAAPDGYSALITGSTFASNLSVSRNPGYRAEEFLPAVVIAGTPSVFVVRADSPIRSLADLVDTARRRPLNYGTGGVGSGNHLLTELLFKRAGGTDATHVPYQGAAPAMAALLAGDIDLVMTLLPTAVPNVRGGRARVIAVTSERRTAALPDVPTVAEAGFPPIVDTVWITVFFPAGTPQAVLERTNADVRQVLDRPAFQQRLAAIGFEPIGGDLATTQAFISSEIARWREIVPTVGVRID